MFTSDTAKLEWAYLCSPTFKYKSTPHLWVDAQCSFLLALLAFKQIEPLGSMQRSMSYFIIAMFSKYWMIRFRFCCVRRETDFLPKTRFRSFCRNFGFSILWAKKNSFSPEFLSRLSVKEKNGFGRKPFEYKNIAPVSSRGKKILWPVQKMKKAGS